MTKLAVFLFLAASAVLCGAQPVDQLPVLGPLPAEVIFVSEKAEPLKIKCVVRGREEGIKYFWQKNGHSYDKQPKDNEGTLIIQKPSKEDEGHYQCFVESKLGVASSRVVTVRRAYIEKHEVLSKKHNPVEGSTYKLECPIPDSYPKPEISWEKFALGSSEPQEVRGQRYTISPEGTLYFSNITKEDASNLKYVCSAKSIATEKPVVLAEHVLEDVTEDIQPKDHEVVQQYVTNDVTLTKGLHVYLYCIYGGNPLAHPDWFKDGQDINNSPKDRVTRYNQSVGKRLVIKEVLPEDEGTYTCSIDNEVGKVQKHSFHVKVVSVPELAQEIAPQQVAKEGQDISFPCRIAGVPEAKIIWTYNAKPLPQSPRYHIDQSHKGNQTIADFTIKKVEKGDTGYYGCKGVNDLGEVYGETLLYVQ